MKAAVLREVKKPLTIEDVQISKPGPREVLIRTVAAGVCHSDVHFWTGAYNYPMPAVLGHESAGVVEQVGSEVRYVQPGDHVITCLSVFCGHCEFCLSGRPSLCGKTDTRRPFTDPPRLSTLRDGAPCPACRDRALDVLPPVLPRRIAAAAIEAPDPELDFGYEGYEDHDDGPRRA